MDLFDSEHNLFAEKHVKTNRDSDGIIFNTGTKSSKVVRLKYFRP